MKAERKLLVVGAGNMGGAIIRSLIPSNGDDMGDEIRELPLTVIDPASENLKQISDDQVKLRLFQSVDELLAVDPKYRPSHILLAVKPQVARTVAGELSVLLAEGVCIISIMAGRSISSIRSDFHDHDVSIVRVMPNLPIQIGKGLSLIYADSSLDRDHVNFATALFQCGGTTLVVGAEDLVDAGTALSGSGPGFIFHLLQGAEDAALEMGFSKEDAKKLIVQTVLGSLQLYDESSESSQTLAKRVTSPGGTTEAGLNELRQTGAQSSVRSAIIHAHRRAKELAT